MLENPERQINPHPNVTIRQTRNAIHILITGAMWQIATSAGHDHELRDRKAAELVTQVKEELTGWEAAP